MLKFYMHSRVFVDKTMRKLEAEVQKRLVIAATLVEGEAKRLLSGPSVSAPGTPPGVVTGALRGGITQKRVGRFTILVGPSVLYGKFLEFGTRNMSARPFMRPAFSNTVTKFPQFFGDLL